MKQCVALLVLGVLILQRGIAVEVGAPRIGKSYFSFNPPLNNLQDLNLSMRLRGFLLQPS